MKKNDWFGPRLKELRKQARLTQGEMAERMDISERHYRQWELGRAEPPLHKLLLLAKHLRVQPWMFFPNEKEELWPASLADGLPPQVDTLARIESNLEGILQEVRALRRDKNSPAS